MSAALWKSIKLTESDGGLESCFKACSVHDEIQKHLKDKEGMTCLRDFAAAYTASDYIVELDKVWQAVEQAKDRRCERARLHSAWQAANAAITALEEAGPGGSSGAAAGQDVTDWEAPLAEDEVEEMRKAWKARYDLIVESHVFPGDPLVNRIYREFRRWSVTTTEIGKMRNILLERQPVRRRETQVSERSSFVEQLECEFTPSSVAEYYFGLRTLANAWAKAGNYEVDSKAEKGAKVLMMPMSVALDYADRALRVTTFSGLHPVEQLPWLERKDRVTRAVMSSHIRERWPAGEALEKALKDTAQDWAVVRGGEVRGPHESLADGDPALGAIRQGSGVSDRPWMNESRVRKDFLKNSKGGKGKGGKFGKGSKGGGSEKSKVGQQASCTLAGKKICGAFNGKKGCKANDKECPNWGLHICNWIIEPNGDVCGARKHGFAGHPRRS